MMYLKQGVKLRDLQTQAVLAMLMVNEYLVNKGIKFTITSVNDGTHMKGSLHYVGKAFDIRTHDISTVNRSAYLTSLKDDIKNILGDEFDVILEDLSGFNEHIHVEWDPKVKLPS